MSMQMIAPDIAAQQMQLTRQQQMAAMLMQQGLAPADPTQVINGWAVKQSPMVGLSKMAQALMGGLAQKNVDQKQLDLSKSLQGRMADILGGGSGPAPQPVDAAPGQLGSGMSDVGNDPSIAQASGAPNIPMPAGQPAMPASVTNPTPMQPQQSNNFDMAKLLRGQIIGSVGGDPAAAAYWKQFEPTDATKMAMAAGVDPREANQGALIKNNYIAPVNARPGAIMRDPRTNMPIAFNPHIPEGATPTFDASGNVTGMNQIPGALSAMQSGAQALASGKAAVTPMAGVDANGNPTYTNALAASGGSPIAAPGTSQITPITNTGPFKGYTPAGNAQTGNMSSGVVTPAAKPGVIEAADMLAKSNAENYTGLQTLAGSSPDRINTLDNMVKLATGGTDFGPGTSGRLDLISSINSRLPSALQFGNDNTANVQVFQKYASNLSQQYQKALGGTGTDAQLANVLKGTPSPDMMNKAITEIVPILKAQELALQAKSSAASDYLVAHNNNPAGMNVFENTWRKNYDPRVYQMSQMAPADRAAFFAKQPDATALKAKVQYALSNGYVQP